MPQTWHPRVLYSYNYTGVTRRLAFGNGWASARSIVDWRTAGAKGHCRLEGAKDLQNSADCHQRIPGQKGLSGPSSLMTTRSAQCCRPTGIFPKASAARIKDIVINWRRFGLMSLFGNPRFPKVHENIGLRRLSGRGRAVLAAPVWARRRAGSTRLGKAE